MTDEAGKTGTPELPHTPPAGNAPKAGPRVLRWVTAFVGFFLLSAGWALATPYDGTPDEMQHVLRAAGVAQGGFAPKPEAADLGTGAFQQVPRSLVRTNCWMFHSDKSAQCAKEPGGDSTVEKTATRAGRYNPVYYAAVGWPLRFWPDWTGITLSRLISAGLTSVFLAFAAYSAVHWTRHRLMLAGVLAATTPMTLHLAGAINPNALEIAAGTALFATLVPMLLDRGPRLSTAPLVVAGVSACTLVTLRSLGPVWCAAALGILLVPSSRETVTALWRSVTARWVAVAIFLATLSAAAWTVLMKASELGSVAGNAPNLTFREAVQYQVLNRWAGFLNEMVGVTSWLDAQPPGWAYTVWFGVVGSLVVWALALGGWVDRWRLVAVTAVAFAVPTVADAMNVNKYGFVSQGRYMLPLAVGVPIIAAFVLGRSGVLDDLRTRKLVRATAVILMPLQLVFLWFTMIRWQSGYTTAAGHSRINAFAGSWHPQVGSVLPVLFAVAGAAALLAFSWTATNAKVPSVRPAQRHPLHARI